MAFVPGATLPTTQSTRANARFVCSAQPNITRRQLLSTAAAAAAALVTSSPAHAKGGEGLEKAFSKVLFPKEGFNAPDTLAPSPSIVNQDVLKTKEASAALKRIQDYDTAIADLYGRFKSDPQIELTTSVKKLVSISDLRNALNVVNEAIDEQSQTETDKVVRGIIQDIGELENAAVLKPGSSRTKKKIERTEDWFAKLTGDFKRLLSFYA